MKKLMTLEQYQQQFSDGASPNMDTLRRRCRKKQIPGAIKQGGVWYVQANQPLASSQPLKPKYSDDPDTEDVFRALMS